MTYFMSFMQKAFCAAADQSAAAGFACGSFRITMDAVLCAVSIFAILALLTAIVGILVSVVVVCVVSVVWIAAGMKILEIGSYNRSAMAHRAF